MKYLTPHQFCSTDTCKARERIAQPSSGRSASPPKVSAYPELQNLSVLSAGQVVIGHTAYTTSRPVATEHVQGMLRGLAVALRKVVGGKIGAGCSKIILVNTR